MTTNQKIGIGAIFIFFIAGLAVISAKPARIKNEAQIITENNITFDINKQLKQKEKELEEAKNQEYLTSKELQRNKEKVQLIAQDLELLFCRESVERLDLTDPSSQEYWKDRMYTFCHDKEMIPLVFRSNDVQIAYSQSEYSPIFSDEEIQALAENTIYDEDYLNHVSE